MHLFVYLLGLDFCMYVCRTCFHLAQLIDLTFYHLQRASDYLSPHLKATDALLHLHAYWARLELSLADDIVAARSVWESLLKLRFVDLCLVTESLNFGEIMFFISAS